MSFLKRFFIVIIALTFVGCSVITLSYNRLPIVAAYQLDSIFDLTDQQSSLARKELDSWLSWHRTTHLPQYATKLKSYEKLIIQDLNPQQFCTEVDVVRRFVDEAVVQFLPALVPIAKSGICNPKFVIIALSLFAIPEIVQPTTPSPCEKIFRG